MNENHTGDIAKNAVGCAVNVGKTAVALAGIGKATADRIKEDAVPQLASAGKAALDSKAGGAAQLAAGGAIAALGVPLLVLPGPGLAVIAGGGALAVRGAKKAFGKREAKGASSH